MDRWKGRVAVVTGASSGIGAAIAEELVKRGLVVVGIARRVHIIEELREKLKNYPGKLFAAEANLEVEEDILKVFEWMCNEFHGIDILVNCAGVANKDKLLDGETSSWRRIFDVNVLALCICTIEAIRSMKTRGVSGHVININSTSGHYPTRFPELHLYCASKHSVTAITEGVTHELMRSGTNIRVTSISPGIVDTDILPMFGVTRGELPSLLPQDIADSVIYALGTPPHIQVREIILRNVNETVKPERRN